MTNKSYKASDVASYFISLGSQTRVGDNEGEFEGITNLKLQKILYFAQAYYLVMVGRNLFNDEIQAWEYGPVVPVVYKIYKKHGSDSIIIHARDSITISDADKKYLDKVWDIFGGYSASRLVDMSHAHAPWKDAYSKGQGAVISPLVIYEYYSSLFGK